jgi:hypothetical protein
MLLRWKPPCILYRQQISDAKDAAHPSSRRYRVCRHRGYSDRAAEDEGSALQLIEILQSLSRDTVQRYEGRVVKFIGDAVLAEFPSTELAVRAAAALSEQYAKESAGIEAGVAVGDWIKHDPDFESLRDHPRFQAIVKRIAPS